MKLLPLVLLGCILLGCNSSKAPEQANPVAGNPPATPPPATVKPSAPAPQLTGNELTVSGIPTYPSADVKGQAATPGSEGESRFNVMLSTPDSVAKVSEFYSSKLGFKATTKDGVAQIVGRTVKKADVIIRIQRDGSETKITIRGIRYKETK